MRWLEPVSIQTVIRFKQPPGGYTGVPGGAHAGRLPPSHRGAVILPARAELSPLRATHYEMRDKQRCVLRPNLSKK